MKNLFLPFVVIISLFVACSPKMKDSVGSDPGTDPTEPTTEVEPEGSMNDNWVSKSQEGIDFIATGNEPFWSVEIDFQKMMTFNTMEEPNKMSTPVPDPVRPQDVNAISYRANTEKGNLYVTIFKEKCTDSMSGLESPYKVRVSMKPGDSDEYQDFMGCGRYIGNYRLNDIWALTEMDGEAVSARDFPNGVPTLDLQLKAGKVFGHAGCNRMNGKFTMGNQSLSFGPLASTKMACPAMQFENKFMAALSGNTLDYELDGLKLHLQGREHRLTFKKVD